MSPTATLSVDEAREASVRAADDLFYRRGIPAVTMAEIRDRSAVSLRRLYSMYPAKSDLVSAWLAHRHEEWLGGYQAGVEQRIAAGDDVVTAIFGALEDWMTKTNFRGCGFINTHAEGSDLTADHQRIIRQHKQGVADYLATLTPAGPALAVLLDGAIVQASIFGSPEPIHLAQHVAQTFALEAS
jgi:AcrR family transcriptional regulator